MKKLKKIVGFFCAFISVINVGFIFSDDETIKSDIGFYIFFALLFAILSFLLLRKKKNKNPIDVSVTVSEPLKQNSTEEQELFRRVEDIKQARKEEFYAKYASNPKFSRSNEEEELSFQFLDNYQEKSDELCNGFTYYADKAREASDIDEKIEYTQKAIDLFYEVRKWHYNHSKGAKIWFQDYWEYCHNSNNVCFSWVDSLEENLRRYKKIRDCVTPWILENAKNGFMQPDIYKAFPEENQGYLRNEIDSLVKQEKITKEKKGSSYYISSKSVN